MTVPLLPGYEAIVDAMVARLVTELPAAIDAINAADTKGVTLDHFDPTRGILDYAPLPSELNVFPAVGIADGPSILGDDTGWSATGNHRLVLVTFVQEPDQGTLATKLRRYTQAVRSVALHQRALGEAWGVVDGGTKPGPTLGDLEGPRPWMSWTATSVDLRSEQSSI